MEGGTVRMPVNQGLCAGLVVERAYGLGIDVHDVVGFLFVGILAVLTYAFNDGLALSQWHAKKLLLPCRLTYLRTESHVGCVISALRITMRQRDIATGEMDDVRIVEDRQSGSFRKSGADQKITIACNPVDSHAAVADATQCVDDVAVVRRFDIVVTGPVFEDVTEQIKLFGPARMLVQKVVERLRRAWQTGLQMQVGNKKRNRCGLRFLYR